MTIDVVISDKIQPGIDTKLQAIANAAELAATKMNALRKAMNLKLSMGNITVSPLQSAAAASQQLAAANNKLAMSNNNVKTSLLGMNASLKSIQHGFSLATTQVRGFLATMVLIGESQRAVNVLDTFGTLQNQLRLSSDSPAQLETLTQGIFDIAQEARVPLDGLAKVWRRVDDAMKQYGAGMPETLNVTQTLASLLTLSGANATEAASSMLQLSQAFSKGKLDGDEFRTTAELMPAVLREIATVLEVPLGALYDLSQQGKITVQVLRDAFKNLYEKVIEDLKRMPKTIGQSLVLLANDVVFALSKNATQSGWVSSITTGLETVRNNLDIVAKAAYAASIAIGSIAVASTLTFLISLVNPIQSLSLALVGAIAYFAYFSNELKVAGENSSTLASAIKVLAQDIASLANGTPLEKLFELGTAQSSLDLLLKGLGLFLSGLNGISAGIVSFGLTSVTAFDSIVKIVDKVITKIKELMNQFTRGATNIGTRAGSSILGWIGDVADTLLPEDMAKEVRAITDTAKSGFDLMGQAARDTYKGIGDENKDITVTIAEEWEKTAAAMKNNFELAFAEIQTATDKWLESINRRGRLLDLEKWNKQLEQPKVDNSSLRPEEIGMPAVAEATRNAAESSRQMAQAFGDIHKYAAGIQEAMRSINSSGFQDLLKYQTQLQNRNIEQSIRSDPNAFLGPRSNWNPDFIKGVAGGGGALDTSQHLQNLTTLSNAVTQIDAQLAQINAAPIAAIGTAAQQAAQKAQQSMATGASAINTSLQQISTSPIDKVNQQVNAVGGQVPQLTTAVQTVGTTAQQAAQQATTATQQAATSAQTASQQISTSIEGGVQAAQQAVASVDGSGFQGITQAAQQAGTTIGQSISQGAQQAGQGIQQMAAQATAAFGQIMQAANQAAEAIRRLIEMQNRAGGGLPGFSSGGYTGNVGVNTPAGIVHGQEYVMPAGPTRKYRDLLEAMRSGRLSTGTMPTGGRGSVGGPNVNVTVENYGSSNIEVQQLSATEIRIIARDEARREGTRAVAQAINNPNSRVSKSLLANTTSTRRR